MTWLLRRLALAGVACLAFIGAPLAQTAIPGVYLSGTAPTGFTQQNFIFHCSALPCSSNNAWPGVEIYNGVGFNSLTNPLYIAPGTGITFPVTGTFWQATQPVSGTFWQATQPVSIATMPTTPVTGTFWQTTQPVSIASMPSTPVTGAFFQTTQPVSPLSGSQWPTINAPDPSPTTGNITILDSGTTCTVTALSQTDCTGAPTAGSAVTATVNSAGYIGVNAGAITGGTATISLSIEVSQDNINWFQRGVFLDSNPAPIWKNNLSSTPFTGVAPGGGVSFWRIRAQTFTVLTGSPSIAITIRQGQASNFTYIGNLPNAANGNTSVSSLNIQGGGGSALAVGVNAQQQAGLTLAAPTAPGVPATSGLVPTVNFPPGGVTASIAGFAPNGNVNAQATIGATSTAATALPAGATVLFQDTGGNPLSFRIGSISVAAATTNDITLQAGQGCAISVGAFVDYTAISPLGTTLNVAGGSGLGACPTGGGGGSGGGGGGGTITSPIGPTTAPSLAVSITDTGIPITGATLGAGGQGLIGWQSQTDADINGPIPVQPSHNVLIGAIEGNGTVTTPDTHVVTTVPPTGFIPQCPGGCVDGGGSSTSTGAFTVLAASGTAGIKEYMTSLQCSRSDAGTTSVTVVITEGTKTRTFVIPPVSGNNAVFATPISFAANTAVTAAFSPTAVTTGYCSAQGFYAP